MSIVTAAARVNGCMTRSMGNGKPLPLDSKEMKGILTYYDWLGDSTEKDLAMHDTRVPSVDFSDRKTDITKREKSIDRHVPHVMVSTHWE